MTTATARQLRLAITRPAAAADAHVEQDLVQVLLDEVRAGTSTGAAGAAGAGAGGVPPAGGHGGAGVLPLLSHALDQAWRTRAGEALTLADYERAGGIEGAVAASAQRAYDGLTRAQQEAARQVFTRLTASGEDGTDTAVRVARADLAPPAPAVGREPAGTAGKDAARAADVDVALETFAAQRLLTLDAGGVEITHEALLTAWPLLRDTWLADARADRIIRTRLHATAAEWDNASRDPAYLYRGGRLADAANPQLATITTGTNVVDALAFSPDGKTLATSSTSDITGGGDTVQLWDTATRRRLGKPLRADNVVGFSAGGKTVVTRTDDAVQVWNVATGRQLGMLDTTTRRDALSVAALNAAGTTLATVNGDTLRLWDVASGRQIGGVSNPGRGAGMGHGNRAADR